MRQSIMGLLAAMLLLSPSLWAGEEGQPEEPQQEEALPEGAPKLPDAHAVDAHPDSSTAEADLEALKDAPAKPGKPKPDLKPERFLWGNFFLGAMGGGLIGAAIGTLASDGSAQGMVNTASIWGGIGLVGGGVLSILLGATTPVPPVPPKVNAGLGQPMLAWTLHF